MGLKYEVDMIVHSCYNEHGKSFENLLAEGIQQANLETIYKQIITSGDMFPATFEKESAKDE